MSFVNDLVEKTANLSTVSKYSTMNGFIYPGAGLALIVWPGVVQTIFMDGAFVGHEAALFRMVGMTAAVIGWLYLFGGRSGGRAFVAASVIDRLVIVPGVLVPLAISGVFPHVLLAFSRRWTSRSPLVPWCSALANRD
jgi:hypothetical protein